MVDDEHWEWVVEHADVACEHLVLATSVPVAMPGGLHDIEEWNELVSEGAWGRWCIGLGEKIRRAVDLEDWSAFHHSYMAMMDLVRDVATPGRRPRGPARTVTIVSGDVHFSFRSRAMFADRPGRPPPASRVHQIVNSPIRNMLSTRERRVIRLGLSRAGEMVGRILRRSAGARRDQTRWDVEDGPFFANHVCLLELGRTRAPGWCSNGPSPTATAARSSPSSPSRRCNGSWPVGQFRWFLSFRIGPIGHEMKDSREPCNDSRPVHGTLGRPRRQLHPSHPRELFDHRGAGPTPADQGAPRSNPPRTPHRRGVPERSGGYTAGEVTGGSRCHERGVTSESVSTSTSKKGC